MVNEVQSSSCQSILQIDTNHGSIYFIQIMQNLVGNDTLIQQHFHSQLYPYHRQEHNEPQHNYAPQSRYYPQSQPKVAVSFQQTHRVDPGEYPASPKFYREDIRYHHQGEDFNREDSHQYSTRLMNQIKPYMDHILSDQTVNSQEVQRGLQHLRDIHEKMVGDSSGLRPGMKPESGLIGDEEDDRRMSNDEQREGDSNYLLEIQRTVDELIANAEQESSSFKASLHHLKNVNNGIFNEGEGVKEAEDEEDHSAKDGWRSRDKDVERIKSGNLNTFFQGISDLQERLFNEIMVLREEKQEAITILQEERESYQELQKKYRILEKEYNKLLYQQDGKSAAYEDFSDIMHKSVHPSASQFKVPEVIKDRSIRQGHTRSRNNIRQQINQLQNRLREAEREKSNLQQQIHHVKGRQRGNQRLHHEIRRLDADLAVSERKAAALFPYKIENDRMIEEIQEIRQGSYEDSQDRSYRAHPPKQDQRYIRQNASYGGGNRAPETHQGRKKSRFADEGDKLSKYRQILNSMRTRNT